MVSPLADKAFTFHRRSALVHPAVEADHGRIEIRRYWTVDRLDWLEDKPQWKGLNLIGMVESERDTGEKVTLEKRYYISSLDNQAARVARALGH